MKTHNGSIHTSRPVTIEGKIDRSTLTGTIGTGTGEAIRLDVREPAPLTGYGRENHQSCCHTTELMFTVASRAA